MSIRFDGASRRKKQGRKEQYTDRENRTFEKVIAGITYIVGVLYFSEIARE